MDAGATRSGNGPDGNPLIGINAAGNVIGSAVYPGNAFSRSAGVFKAIANACAFTSGPVVVPGHRMTPTRTPAPAIQWRDPNPTPVGPRATDPPDQVVPLQSRKARN